jgi:hypothetical protein
MRHQKSLNPKTILLLSSLLLVFLLSGCFSTKQANVFKPETITKSLYNFNQERVNQILKTAFSQVGNPYRYGGNTPETGFDCSGFVGWVYKQFGLSLPRSARDMMSAGEPISREELRPGDLVFFNYTYYHVGIYTGNDKYIHSPRTGKRIEEVNLSSKGRGDHFLAARRIINNVGVSDISDHMKTQWIAQSRHQTDMDMQVALGKKHSVAPTQATAAIPQRVYPSTASVAKTPSIYNTSSNNTSVRTASVSKIADKKTTTTKTTANINTKTKKTVKKSGNSKQISHKVVSGDNIVTLAKRYGINSTDIVQANNLTNKHKLKLGQKLIIPAKAKDIKVAKKATTTSSKTKTVKASPKVTTKTKATTTKPSPKTTNSKKSTKANT